MKLVSQLSEVVDGSGAAQAGVAGSARLGLAAIGQIQAAAAAVQADGRAALLV